jgi:hypothetical protein
MNDQTETESNEVASPSTEPTASTTTHTCGETTTTDPLSERALSLRVKKLHGSQENLYDLKSDILKSLAQGFSGSEIVKTLSKKYQKTPRAIWYHLADITKWAPRVRGFSNPQKNQVLIINGILEGIRDVEFLRCQTNDDRVKLNCIQTRLEGWVSLGRVVPLPDALLKEDDVMANLDSLSTEQRAVLVEAGVILNTLEMRKPSSKSEMH